MGRPKLPDNEKQRHVQTRVSPKAYERLVELAEKEGTSVFEIARRILEKELLRRRK